MLKQCSKFDSDLSGEMSAKRHIISFEVWKEPFIQEGWEYIELRVKGQSFMIHQIRKMIGLIIARSSGYCGDDHIERAFDANFEDIPKVYKYLFSLHQSKYRHLAMDSYYVKFITTPITRTTELLRGR